MGERLSVISVTSHYLLVIYWVTIDKVRTLGTRGETIIMKLLKYAGRRLEFRRVVSSHLEVSRRFFLTGRRPVVIPTSLSINGVYGRRSG